MLEIIRDDDGNIKSVCEWSLVNEKGQIDDNGEYVWIHEAEISVNHRNNGSLAKFIKIITDRVPWAKYGYFSRRKYNDRKKLYTKEQWLRRI